MQHASVCVFSSMRQLVAAQLEATTKTQLIQGEVIINRTKESWLQRHYVSLVYSHKKEKSKSAARTEGLG